MAGRRGGAAGGEGCLRLEEQFEQARGGDTEAWARLVALAHPSLVRWLAGHLPARLSRRVAADDLAQEVWTTAWQRRASFSARGPGSLCAWLRGIARNKLGDATKRARTGKRDTAREAGTASQAPERGRSPSSAAGGREQRALARWLLTLLRPGERRVIALVLFEDLPLAEAGARLEPPLGAEALRKRYERALHVLVAAELAYRLLCRPKQRVLRWVHVEPGEPGRSSVQARLEVERTAALTPEGQRLLDEAQRSLRAGLAELRRLTGGELEALRDLLVERRSPAAVARRLALDPQDVRRLGERAQAARARLGCRDEPGEGAAPPLWEGDPAGVRPTGAVRRGARAPARRAT